MDKQNTNEGRSIATGTFHVGVKLIMTAGFFINKAVLTFDKPVDANSLHDNPLILSFSYAPRKYLKPVGEHTTVECTAINTYLSDADGNMLIGESTAGEAEGCHVTMEYTADTYSGAHGDMGTTFTNIVEHEAYSLALAMGKTIQIGGTVYSALDCRLAFEENVYSDIPDGWDMTGRYESSNDVKFGYGVYRGADNMFDTDGQKHPLILWLHGSVEGGDMDPVPAVYSAVQLSREPIQNYFGGAYVVIPRCPTMWMDGDGGGLNYHGGNQAYYTAHLWEFIKYFVANNPGINTNRIYIAGYSNGGYMTLNMLFTAKEYTGDANYFAGAVPIAGPYGAGGQMDLTPMGGTLVADYDGSKISDSMLDSIKDNAIWFVHSLNDVVVPIAKATPAVGVTPENIEVTTWTYFMARTNEIINGPAAVQTYSTDHYIRLLAAGAERVHYTCTESDGHDVVKRVLADEVLAVQRTSGSIFSPATLNPNSDEYVQVDGENSTIWRWLAQNRKHVL